MKARIILSAIAASLLLFFFSPAHSEKDIPRAILQSYDYSSDLNFGSGYQTEGDIQRNGKSKTNVDCEIPDIEHSQRNEESKWLRLWLRIHVFTPQNEEWDHPQQYSQAIQITNVKVSSTDYEGIHDSTELLPACNALPLNCSTATIDNSYDNWDEYWEKLFPNWSLSSPYCSTSYWNQTLKSGETEWILELLVREDGQDAQDIDHLVRSLRIQFEINASYCELSTRKVCVINGDARREVRFDEKAVQFRANSFYEEHFENMSEKAACFTAQENALLCSNDFYSHAFHTAPEQYALLGVSINMQC